MTNKIFDKLGLLVLLTLLVLTSMHSMSSGWFTYYREFIAVVFVILWFITVFLKKRDQLDIFVFRREIIFIVLFPLLLSVWSLFDPGISLYNKDLTDTSSQLTEVNPKIYVIRNATLYLPMILYMYVRGLTEKEIQLICVIIIAFAPISILILLNMIGIENVAFIVMKGGTGTAYNSYVPYLTFAVLAAMYIMFSEINRLIKITAALLCMVLTFYVIITTSRSSLVFIVLSVVIYFVTSKNMTPPKKIIILGTFIAAAFFAFHVISNLEYSQRYTDRFRSVGGFLDGDSRVEIALEGLGMLNLSDFFIGAGLTSVIGSGPHNDYILWTQRTGIFLMLLGFWPFIIFFNRGRKMIMDGAGSPLVVFLTLSIAFTLFHSLFAHPRESAYLAPYAFLGVAFWVGHHGRFSRGTNPHARDSKMGPFYGLRPRD